MPFIDERKLLDAAASVPAEALSAEERGRNRLGDILAFRHVPGGGAPRPARPASGRVCLHVALLTRPCRASCMGQLAHGTNRQSRACLCSGLPHRVWLHTCTLRFLLVKWRALGGDEPGSKAGACILLPLLTSQGAAPPRRRRGPEVLRIDAAQHVRVAAAVRQPLRGARAAATAAGGAARVRAGARARHPAGVRPGGGGPPRACTRDACPGDAAASGGPARLGGGLGAVQERRSIAAREPAGRAIEPLARGAQGEGGPPGYPTLRTLVVEPELRAAGVDVLGQPSKKESLILKVKARPRAAPTPGEPA